VPRFCGCGSPETNIDGDGALDCIDNCPTDASKTIKVAVDVVSPIWIEMGMVSPIASTTALTRIL